MPLFRVFFHFHPYPYFFTISHHLYFLNTYSHVFPFRYFLSYVVLSFPILLNFPSFFSHCYFPSITHFFFFSYHSHSPFTFPLTSFTHLSGAFLSLYSPFDPFPIHSFENISSILPSHACISFSLRVKNREVSADISVLKASAP